MGEYALIKGRLGWKSLKKNEYVSVGPCMIAGKHISNGVIDWKNVDHIPMWRYVESPEIMLQNGDLIFSKDGSLGNPALISNLDRLATINSTMMLVRVNEKIAPAFFYQILSGEHFNNLISLKISGSSIPHLFQGDMNKFSFYAPSRNEQTQIGNFFKQLDETIALHKRKLKKQQNSKKFYLEKMFPKENSLFPEIRFPNFTDAWEQRKLKEISDKIIEKNTNNIFSETFTNSAEFGVITQRDFFDKEISNKAHLSQYYIVENNDFIYNPRVSNFAPVGPIKRNKLGRTGVMSPLYYVFRIRKIDYSFLEYFFETTKWHTFMRLNGDNGARSDRFSIKDEIFSEMPIALPSIDEQIKIGNLFKQLDETIALHKRKLAKLFILKSAFLTSIFCTRNIQINTQNPISWEQRKLGEILKIRNGRSQKNIEKTSGKYPILATSGEIGRTNSYLYDKESVCIGRKGTIDKPYYMHTPFWTVDTLFYSELTSYVNGRFIYSVFQIIQWLDYNASTGVPSLTSSTIHNIKISIPNKQEQTQIGNFFKQLDETIALHKRKQRKYEQIKQIFLRKMLVD